MYKMTKESIEKETLFVAQTNLPTSRGILKIRAYRDKSTGKEPLALFYTDPSNCDDVPVRIHDACITSEIFGSLKCDCKDQLDYAMNYIYNNSGMVIYLQQEGRGIGIANKIAAYALQEQGLDTIEANRALHLPIDCREYNSAASIISDMNISSIQLLTNNPRKIQKLVEQNITVSGRLEVLTTPNQHSIKYMETKRQQMGHLLKNLST